MKTELLEAIEKALEMKRVYAQEEADEFKRQTCAWDYLVMSTVAAAYSEAARVVRLEFERFEREALISGVES